MKSRIVACLSLICVLTLNFSVPADVFIGKTGWVRFVSEAPLESIEAENKKVAAVIDVSQKSVAFKVPITGFQGFNSALQHEHFDENYMEVNNYPQATFTGKIIEDVDLSTPGSYKVRAKGMLTIHGVEKERIIAGMIKVSPGVINITTDFEVPLSDHDIDIPKIVNQKIAEVINVQLKAELKPQ